MKMTVLAKQCSNQLKSTQSLTRQGRINNTIVCLSQLVREALLAGELADAEQLSVLSAYKKEFSWVNQLLFDTRYGLVNHSAKPHLCLIKTP